MDFSITLDPFIKFLQTLPPEVISVFLAVFCGGVVLAVHRYLGILGLYVYYAVSLIAANIQVLTAAKFSVSSQPIALGTALFTSIFLCTDIMTEHYGPKAARKAVKIGFMIFSFFIFLMVVTIGYAPLKSTEHSFFIQNHEHIKALFLPVPAIFVASMVAYFASQYNDIWIFNMVSKLTKGKLLWLRSNASTMISSFVDSVIFSVLAWVVFAPVPMDTHTLVFTYILGTYAFRVFFSIFYTPFIYFSKHLMPKHDRLS